MNDTAGVSAEPLRVLALMAHPDDAEISCAGTLIRLARAGWEVHIATVAARPAASETICPAWSQAVSSGAPSHTAKPRMAARAPG